MAKLVLKDASVVFGAADLSDHVRSATVDFGADAVEDTTMGDEAHSNIAGLFKQGATVELAQDFADGSVDALVFPLVGTTATLTIKPTSAAVGPNNPAYSFEAILADAPPLGNSVGDLATTTLRFEPAGGAKIERATA